MNRLPDAPASRPGPSSDPLFPPEDAAELSPVADLLERTARVIGLFVCFHDSTHKAGIPLQLRTHETAPCRTAKASDGGDKLCRAFGSHEVHRALAGRPEGRIHVCPHGYTEIAVPVPYRGLHGGVLFAGQCWVGPGDPPHPDLVVPPSWQWMEDRRQILQSVAAQVERLLLTTGREGPVGRRRSVLQYLAKHLDQPLTLADLAEQLHLSESRTGHVIREEFGLTFPALLNRLRLREAAHLLTGTGWSIGEIAVRCGFVDQNYFSRLFRRQYGLTPRDYRRRYPSEA